jgi:hypothetical protein
MQLERMLVFRLQSQVMRAICTHSMKNIAASVSPLADGALFAMHASGWKN